MSGCENCDSADAVAKDGRQLCMSCWIEELDRDRSTGTMERVREERRRRERTFSAAFSPAQRTVSEFGGGSA